MANELAITITLLIAAQSSNSFQARNDANELLLQLAPFTELHLKHFMDSPDLEIRSKCYQNLSCMGDSLILAQLWNKEYPYLDMIPLDFKGRQTTINDWLDPKPVGVANWPQYRTATKRWIAYLYRNGTPTDEIKYLLLVMDDNETKWKERNPHVARSNQEGK